MIKKLTDSPFVKNVITLMVGSILSQGIVVLISPILTRLYTPEDFGLFSLYISITSTLAIIICARYEIAIIIPKKNEDSINVVALCIVIATVISLLLLSIATLFKHPIALWLNNPRLEFWLLLAPLGLFFTAAVQILNAWQNRKKRYKLITSGAVTTSSTSAITNTVLGILQKPYGLIVGNILSQITTAINLSISFFKNDRPLFKHITKKDMTAQAKRFIDYPKYNCIPALLARLASQGPIFFLGIFYNATLVGLYALSMRILTLPAQLISSAVSRVYLQEMAEAHHANKSLLPLLLKTTKNLSLIAILPMIIIIPFGPTLFSLIFGAQWEKAGMIAQVLCVIVAIRFVVSPLSNVFAILEKVKMGSLWQGVYSITTLLTLWVASQYSFKTFLIAYTIHDIVLYLGYFGLILYAIRTTSCAES